MTWSDVMLGDVVHAAVGTLLGAGFMLLVLTVVALLALAFHGIIRRLQEDR